VCHGNSVLYDTATIFGFNKRSLNQQNIQV